MFAPFVLPKTLAGTLARRPVVLEVICQITQLVDVELFLRARLGPLRPKSMESPAVRAALYVLKPHIVAVTSHRAGRGGRFRQKRRSVGVQRGLHSSIQHGA